MNRERFWNFVGAARSGAGDDDERFLERLHRALGALPAREILEFRDALDRTLQEAYRWDLWAAAYILNGTSSEDGFESFRGWIISRGREVFERAVEDPETLAELVPKDPAWNAEFEEFLYLPVYVYEQVTGEELPLPESVPDVTEPAGERWREDRVEAMYPKLRQRAAERFSEG